MEATGVYWKPIYNLLEGDFEILVVNAHHIKTVPGRKTDVKDAEWIADLLSHGLLSASFMSYRTKLVEERTREINRLQKTLEETNLKLGDVVSDVMGKTAQMILRAVVDGEADPVRFAVLAAGRVRASQETLERALTGKVTAHHRFLLGEHLTPIMNLDEAIKRVNEEIARRFTPPEPPPTQERGEENQLAPTPVSQSSESSLSTGSPPSLSWQEAVEIIDQMTGISERVAQGLLAEIGVNRDNFPPPTTSHPGLGYAPAIMRALANDFLARPARGTHMRAGFSFRLLMPLLTANRAIWLPSTVVLPLDEEPRKQLLRLAIAFS